MQILGEHRCTHKMHSGIWGLEKRDGDKKMEEEKKSVRRDKTLLEKEFRIKTVNVDQKTMEEMEELQAKIFIL